MELLMDIIMELIPEAVMEFFQEKCFGFIKARVENRFLRGLLYALVVVLLATVGIALAVGILLLLGADFS